MSSIAIVVLNWNGLEDTKECLRSLYLQTHKDYSVILVENGSSQKGTDSAMRELQEKYPNLHIIKNARNLGFAGGVNSGIQYALKHGFEYVALFNNDAVADKNWLKELVDAQKKHTSGITTGLLLHADAQTIDSTGDWCSNWGLPFPRDRNKPTSQASGSGFVFSGSGGASLYSAQMLKQIGLFDESFFAYYEDTDISFRAQLLGWKVYYTDTAIAYHKQGATSSKLPGFTVQQTFKNLPLFFQKNMPTRLLLKYGWKFWLAYVLMFLNAVKNGNAMPAVHGYVQHVVIFWRFSIWQRFTIQKKRSVSSSYIDSMLWKDLPPDQTGLRKFRAIFTGKH